MPVEATVYVVDDDAEVRDSLELLLEAMNFGVKVFPSAKEFLAHQIDGHACLVTDLRMPEMDGLELQEELSRRGIGIPVIIMTAHGDVPLAVRAMKAGAADFIEKPFDEGTLIESVRRALASSTRSAEHLAETAALRERLAELTAREREVFERVATGKPNKTVAFDLGISQRTVEIHRAHVMDKLDARNLADLVRIWLSIQSGA